MIEYEALLVTAPRSRSGAARPATSGGTGHAGKTRVGGALRWRSTRCGGRARGARTGKPRGIPASAQGERLLGEGPGVEEGVVSSSARSRSTGKSARHASSLRPRPCSPAPSGAPPRRPAATRRSVPLSLREAAEEDEPDEADDQLPPEAPEDDQDDPHDDEDPAKTDAHRHGSPRSPPPVRRCAGGSRTYPRWIREQNAIENCLPLPRRYSRRRSALRSAPPPCTSREIDRMQSEMKRRLRFAFAIALVVAVTVVAASAIAFAGRDAKGRSAVRRLKARAPAAAEQIRAERRDSFRRTMLEAHATRCGAGRLVRSRSRRADSNPRPLSTHTVSVGAARSGHGSS